MTDHVPRLPISLDPLVREAKWRMRRRRTAVSVAIVALSLLSYGAFRSLNVSPTPSPAVTVGVNTIFSNALAQQSVHYTSYAVMGANSTDYTAGDVALGRGILRLTDRVGMSKKVGHTFVGKTYRYTITVVVIGRSAYVRGPARALRTWLWPISRARARLYAGRWISVPRGSNFAYLAQGGTLESFLHGIMPRGRVKTSVSTVKGRKVIGLTRSTFDGSQFLSVDASTLLPIEAGYAAPAGMGGTKISRWNAPLHVSTPTHSTPLATVRHG